ncbi:unnamed protein product [Cercospora beticola]|nr:unnamed protein product [Cercospora beticola]
MLLQWPLLGLLLAQQGYADYYYYCKALRDKAGLYHEDGTGVIKQYNKGAIVTAMCYNSIGIKVHRGHGHTAWVLYTDEGGSDPWWKCELGNQNKFPPYG